MEFLGIHIPFTAKKEVVTPVETESERLARLKAKSLAERATNSRTQSGAGAYDGTSIPPTAAEPGKPVFTKLREQGQGPAKDNTNSGSPL